MIFTNIWEYDETSGHYIIPVGTIEREVKEEELLLDGGGQYQYEVYDDKDDHTIRLVNANNLIEE